MLINCNKIQDKLVDGINKFELHTVGGDRICEYYTDIIVNRSIMYVEIPICAIDIKYFEPNRNKDTFQFSSKDKSIRNIPLVLEDIEYKKQGNLYINAKYLYKLS